MKITLEIKEEVLQNALVDRIADTYEIDGEIHRAIVEAVKECVYSEKEEIINRVVDRATAEIKRKAMPKLLEAITE